MARPMKIFVIMVALLSFSLFFPMGAKADNFGLLVQHVDINPKVAELGETVSIKFDIKNAEKTITSCTVSAFCGDCILGTREITVGAKSSITLFFELDTSCMCTGVYSIEALIEIPSSGQKTFNLGNIPIEENNPTEEGNPVEENNLSIDENKETESTNSAFFNWQFLIPVVPIGAVASVLILGRKRKESQDLVILGDQLSNSKNPVNPKDKISHMFNEILKLEENKVEDETSPEAKNKYAKFARARALLDI